MDEKLNPKDKVLLMRDEEEGNKLKVVKGIDKKGKIDAIDPMKAKETDFLKIDKSFVFEMEDTSVRSSLIPEIVAIAKAVNAEVIAEGVENEAQANKLHEMGARFGQGYLFARPMPIKDFVAYYLASQTPAAPHLAAPESLVTSG